MAYTPATKIPGLQFFQWSTPLAPTPRLASPIDADDTTLTFTSAPKDYTGAVIPGNFLMNVTNSSGFTELIYVPTGKMSVDGLTATDVIRGVRISGTDYTTGDSTFADSHEGDSPVGCAVNAVYEAMKKAWIQGTLASGATGLVIGTEPGAGSETITVYRTTTAGVRKGVFRWNITSGKAEYSNDGTNWISFDAASASNLVVVTGADTTPSTLDGKITVSSGSGATVTKSVTSAGGDERLNIDVALNVGTASIGNRDNSYTPAYVTSGANVFSTFNLWTGTSDGAFRVTIDGTLRSITGCNFTACTSMAEVATVMQVAIRAVTSGVETVVWNVGTSRMIINSGLTTSSSSITVLTAGLSGTDISGAGANAYLDMDVGNGVVTNVALNVVGDANKLVKLDSDGYLAGELLGDSVPTVRVYSDTSLILGSSSTQFDITNTAGTTFRYTWDGTGTNPNISSATIPTGTVLLTFAQNFAAGNKGEFTVTASGANYFEVTNAGGTAENNKTIGTGSIKIQTKSYTWTKPSWLKYIVVEVVGGGGNGSSASSSAGSSGGGGGGYSKKTITGTSLGTTETVTLGFGAMIPYIYDGRTSSFGIHCSASGGGQPTSSSGGAGGVGTGGDLNINGNPGSGTGIDGSYGGVGGGTVLGGGGQPAAALDTKGGTGGAYGGGGGGCADDSSPTALGGDGGNGVVIITEYF